MNHNKYMMWCPQCEAVKCHSRTQPINILWAHFFVKSLALWVVALLVVNWVGSTGDFMICMLAFPALHIVVPLSVGLYNDYYNEVPKYTCLNCKRKVQESRDKSRQLRDPVEEPQNTSTNKNHIRAWDLGWLLATPVNMLVYVVTKSGWPNADMGAVMTISIAITVTVAALIREAGKLYGERVTSKYGKLVFLCIVYGGLSLIGLLVLLGLGMKCMDWVNVVPTPPSVEPLPPPPPPPYEAFDYNKDTYFPMSIVVAPEDLTMENLHSIYEDLKSKGRHPSLMYISVWATEEDYRNRHYYVPALSYQVDHGLCVAILSGTDGKAIVIDSMSYAAKAHYDQATFDRWSGYIWQLTGKAGSVEK